MDTKSKKFSYSVAMKTVCFLLSCVFAVTGAISLFSFAINFYEKEASYEDAFGGIDDIDMVSTYSFSETCQDHISSIMLKALYFKDSSEQTFLKAEKSIIDRNYNRILEECMSAVEGLEERSYANLVYICDGYSEYGDIYYYYENLDGQKVEVPKGADRLYFSNGKIYSVTFDKKELYSQTSEEVSRIFYRNASENAKTLSSVKNLRYAVKNNTDKTFYTNVKTLNNNSSSADLQKYFSSYAWNFYINSEGRSTFSDDIASYRHEEQNQPVGLFGYYERLSIDTLTNCVRNAVETYGFSTYSKGLSSSDQYEIYVSFDESLSGGVDDYSAIIPNISGAFRNMVSTAVIFSICSLVVVASLVFLVATAGRKEKGGEVKLVATDRIFSFLHLAVSFVVFAVCLLIVRFACSTYLEKGIFNVSKTVAVILMSVPTLIGYCALSEWLMSFARNVKNKSFFKNTLIGKIIFNERFKTKLPKESKKRFYVTIILIIAYTFLLIVFSLLTSFEDWFVIPLFFLVLCAAAFVLVSAYYIVKLIEQLQNNNSNQNKPGSYPVWLRDLAEYISLMQKNTNDAIEAAVKDEKMKTQLITNVSHDLKTPLTAVINYADLLSKCEIDNEQAREYIAVINEKTDRLKKLIEDLTEAAKASSGNIQTNIVALNLNEIAVQIAGETDESLNAKNLELILKIPEKPVLAAADSRLTCRILENLMSNVRKYAMPNTRVYLMVDENKSISISNISENALNISPAELKERFVRGDESRTTEGSGLGLAIADDLCKIQGGRLDISIDGDLFKATVYFGSIINNDKNKH